MASPKLWKLNPMDFTKMTPARNEVIEKAEATTAQSAAVTPAKRKNYGKLNAQHLTKKHSSVN